MAKAPAAPPAKASAGMANDSKKPRRAIGSPTGNLLILCTLIVLGIVSFPAFLLFCFGMLPTGVAYVVDRHRRWALTITVMAPNLTATTIFIINLVKGGATINAVMDMMSNPVVWGVVYLSAAVGWGIYQAMPVVVTSAKEYRLEMQRSGHEDHMKSLREEWGDEIMPAETLDAPKRQRR